jgi:carbon-monoxide dehydrogenase small subunit
MTLTADLRHNPPPAQQQVRDMLAGNLCRCTGYQGMVDAVPALVESGRLDAPPAEAAR